MDSIGVGGSAGVQGQGWAGVGGSGLHVGRGEEEGKESGLGWARVGQG